LRTFVYDGEQRLQSVTQPETGTVTDTYDALSRTSTKTDAKNQKVQYICDSHSRVSEVRRYPVSSGAEDATQRTTFYYKRSGLVEEKGLYAPGAAARTWCRARSTT
jgi:YD repeat-containing protein